MVNNKEINILITQLYLTKFYFHSEFLDNTPEISPILFDKVNLFLSNFSSILKDLVVLKKEIFLSEEQTVFFIEKYNYIYDFENVFNIRFKENIINVESIERKDYLIWLKNLYNQSIHV